MILDAKLSLVWLGEGNEAAVAVAAARASGAMPRFVRAHEILLVASRSNNRYLRLAEENSAVRLVMHNEKGLGAALTAGCAATTGDYLLVLVGNTPLDWGALASLTPLAEQFDLVAAYRPVPLPRADAVARAVLWWLFGVALRDPLQPLQLFRAEMLRGLDFIADGPLVRAELLAKARLMGASVVEVGVPTAPDSGTAWSALRWVWSAALLRLALRRWRAPWTVHPALERLRPPVDYAVGGVAIVALLQGARAAIARGGKGGR